MLKSIMFNRCFLCTMVQSHILPRFISSQVSSLFELDNDNIDHNEIKKKFSLQSPPWKRRPEYKKPAYKNMQAIKDVLDKYNIETSELNVDSKLAYKTPWVIEKRIMLLHEIGVPQVSFSLIENFIHGMKLNAVVFKAHANMDHDTNIAQNMLSYIKSVDIDYKIFNHLDENNASVRQYYVACLYNYMKLRLKLTEEEFKDIPKKTSYDMYNSFTLLERMFAFCKDDLGMDISEIKRNWWICYRHPEQVQIIKKMLTEHYGDITEKYIKKYPRVLTAIPDDLQLIIKYMDKYEITSEMALVAPQVFVFKPFELKKRLEHLLENSFTKFYKRHPRFLLLLKHYYTLLPRIAYLREKNLSYGTIHALVTFHNPIEQLTLKKKLNTNNTNSFFETNFGKDADDLKINFKKHPFYGYSSPVQMSETLFFLREKFTKGAIYNNIYAILYHKNDVETAYKLAMKDPKYSEYSKSQLLALCIYKIEEIFHYTGEGILSPGKFAELHQENTNIEDEQNLEQQDQEEKTESNVFQSYDTQCENNFRNK